MGDINVDSRSSYRV